MGLLSAAVGPLYGSVRTGLFDPINRGLGYAVNLAVPVALPSPLDFLNAWRAGLLPSKGTGVALRCQGISLSEDNLVDPNLPIAFPGRGSGFQAVWANVFNAQFGRPGIEMLVQLLMRGQITQEKFVELAKFEGWWKEEMRDLVRHFAANQIPQPGELVTFAVRDVWKQHIVDRFDYDAEPSAEFGYWMNKLGFNGDARIKVDGVPQGQEVKWSDLYWRAHWTNISPTQAYEMYQRLRPNRLGRYRENLPGIRAFELSDLLMVLQVNDYPVPFREQLAAIAYHKPRLVDIDRFFTSGAIDYHEAYELHLDLGYAPADARTRVAWLEKEKVNRPRDPQVRAATKHTVDLFRLGVMSQNDAIFALVNILSGGATFEGATEEETAVQRRRRDGFVNQSIVLLAQATAAESVVNARILLRAVKAQFLSGQINADSARAELVNNGFAERAVANHVARWSAILASGRMLLSTANVRTLILEGVMPFETGKQYLANLGWKDPELSYLLRELRHSLDLEAEKAAERLARDQEQAERAQIRQAQILNRERERTVRRLNRQASLAQLLRYFTRSIISEGDYERELRRRGIDDENVKRHIFDARIEKADRARKRGRVRDIIGQQDPNRTGALTPNAAPSPARPADEGDARNPFNPLG